MFVFIAVCCFFLLLFFDHVGCVDTCGVAVAENWISLSFDKKKGSVTLWPEVDVNIYKENIVKPMLVLNYI